MASLEGMWLGECGQSAQNEVQRAVELAGQKKWDEAREMLEQVVHDFPEFAYAWNKLAMVEYQSGEFDLVFCVVAGLTLVLTSHFAVGVLHSTCMRRQLRESSRPLRDRHQVEAAARRGSRRTRNLRYETAAMELGASRRCAAVGGAAQQRHCSDAD
ncbi:hypothetical protein ON010_g14046 [Phytophthora cinnamomi]|nr:hypothetical protein ON010_g14046 [Phytophthora cinnamomi]